MGEQTVYSFPDGTKRSYLSGWNVNSSKRFFTLAQATGEPWIKTWYDNQGREVLVETIGPQSMSIKEATTYNNKGLITQKRQKLAILPRRRTIRMMLVGEC